MRTRRRCKQGRRLWIKDWDFNWQGGYNYAKPVPLCVQIPWRLSATLAKSRQWSSTANTIRGRTWTPCCNRSPNARLPRVSDWPGPSHLLVLWSELSASP